VQGDNRELPTTAQADTASPVDHHPHPRNRSRSKSGGFCLETIRPKTASYVLAALIENESLRLSNNSSLYRAALERTRDERSGRLTKSTRPLDCMLKRDHAYKFLTNHTCVV
jgi:hypothetical protein